MMAKAKQTQKDLVRQKLADRVPIDSTEITALLAVKQEDQRPAVVADFLIMLSKTLLYGMAKRLKTMFVMYLTMLMAAGMEVCGRQSQQISVLYISAEQKEWHLADRVEKMRAKFADVPGFQWQLYYLRPDERTQERIEQLVAEYKPGLLVLDPLAQLVIPEDKPTTWEDWFKFWDRLIEDYDITLLLVHHRRKGAPQVQETLDNMLDDIRGTSKLAGWLNNIIAIVRQQARVKDDIEVGFELRDAQEDIEDLGYHFVRETCLFEPIPTKANKRTGRQDAVAQWLNDHCNGCEYEKVSDMIEECAEVFGYNSKAPVWKVWSELG